MSATNSCLCIGVSTLMFRACSGRRCSLDAVARVSVHLCLSACSGCGTPFPKIGFGVSTLMLKNLFGSPLEPRCRCSGVSTLMFKSLFGRKRTATVSPTDRKHDRVSAA